TWDLSTLDAGETGEKVLRVSVDDLKETDPLVRGARATLTSGTAAATASIVTMVQPAPRSLAMVANPDPLSPGQFITYELTVTNHGQDDAVQVKITMPIPGGLTGACIRLSDDAATPDGCSTGRDVLWTLDTLPAGTSRTVQAIYDPLSLANGSILPASAWLQDAAGSHARARVSTIFHSAATSPLGVALTESADPVVAGDELDYTIRFGNHGTASILGAQLVLTLPPGVTVTNAGGGTPSGDRLTWSLG